MINFKKISFIAFVIVFSYVSIFPVALAQTENALIPYGGLVTYMMPCTCSQPAWWVYLAPLHPISPIAGGALAYAPGRTKLYMYYFVRPGGWALGHYIPGIQTCYMYVGLSCVVVPVFGEMFSAGTSGIE